MRKINIRYVMYVFLTFFLNSSHANTYIYFLNGASNSTENSISSSAEKVRKIIYDYKVSSKGGVVFSYIPIPGSFHDDYEIKYQQEMSSESMRNTFVSPKNYVDMDLYLHELGGMYLSEYIPKNIVRNGYSEISIRTAIKQTNIISNIFENRLVHGDSIVIVSHSQGNLYAEGALALLHKKLGNEYIRNRVRVVNLGSVSAISYNRRWLSLSQDKFISDTKLGVLVRDGIFAVTPSNENACLSPCSKIASNAELVEVGADARAHGIKETYANNAVYSFDKKQSLPSLIANYVQEAIDILEGPIVASVSPLVATVTEETVFTVEGSNLSAGMGFAVNDCSPSSVEIAGGTSTKRQFKCTMGQSTGEKNGVIKNRPGGVTAFEFKVQAVLSQVGTWESTISADGFTVKNIFYKNLSALPNGKTVFAGKHTVKYGTSCDLGQDLEVTIDRNGASFGITTVTKSAKTECREGNIHLYTADLGSTTIRDGKLENGILILNRWNGCDSTINNVCYYYDSIKPR